ncbi:sigma factor regulator N-terminal domain-containing protein [Faecalimonas sp.]
MMIEKNKNNLTEKLLDQELEMLVESVPEQEMDFEKKIEKCINKKIRRITAKTVAAIVGVLVILFLLISPCMNTFYLNPQKLQKDQTFLSVMRDYYDITRPYIEINNIQVEKKGFGRYRLGISATDNFKKREIGVENVWVDLEQGKYKNWQDPERLLITRLGEFENVKTKEEIEQLIQEIEKLPKSAEISLAISENRERDVEELRKEKVRLDWIEVYHPNKKGFQGGLNLWRTAMFEASDDREKMDEEKLLKVYVKNLKNLVNHPDIWNSLELPYRSTVWADGTEEIKACYEDAKTLKKLQTKAYYISGQKDDILEYIKKTTIKTVSVYSVKSNVWE